jgi:hypothetical protein
MATARESITESYNLREYIKEFGGESMELCPNNKGRYITCKYLSYGDYDNSGSVERSNVAYIIENYAKNRYYEVIGAYGYTQIYLKNTEINAELICALDDYPCIDDEYHAEWEYTNAKAQFIDSTLDECEPIYNALEQYYSDSDTDVDISDIDNSDYFWNLYMLLCEDHCDNGYYFESGGAVVLTLKSGNADTLQCCLDYFNDNPMFTKLIGDELILELSQHATHILAEFTKGHIGMPVPQSDNYIICCLCLHSYTSTTLYYGGADYMSSHLDPFEEIEIDACSTFDDVMSQLVWAYDSICESSYEQLDKIPT